MAPSNPMPPTHTNIDLLDDLGKNFEISDLGIMRFYLGVEIL